MHQAVTRRVAFVREAAGDLPSPVARVQAMVKASVRHAVSNPGLIKPMYRAAAELRGLRRAAARVGLGQLSGALEEAVRAGELREDAHPQLLAELLMQVVHETSLAWALDELGDDELDARCQHTLAVLLAAAAHPDQAEALQRALRESALRLAHIQDAAS